MWVPKDVKPPSIEEIGTSHYYKTALANLEQHLAEIHPGAVVADLASCSDCLSLSQQIGVGRQANQSAEFLRWVGDGQTITGPTHF
jgi:hypothetical protein